MRNIILTLKSKFGVEILKEEKKQIWLKADKKNLLKICSLIKKNGFNFFSSLTAVDILEKNVIELIYHIWSEEKKTILNIKIKIDRERPEISSVSNVYDASQIHEREIRELFGVNFLGNPDLSSLFLEDWSGPAPFLKSFDWRNYVRKKFYSKENKRERGYFT